jgi:hypothetical protein
MVALFQLLCDSVAFRQNVKSKNLVFLNEGGYSLSRGFSEERDEMRRRFSVAVK